MTHSLRTRLLPLAIAALFAASGALAQNTSSSLSGHVTDAAGRPLAGATVQIVHVPSGTTRVVTTDANGGYNAQGLRVGGPFTVVVLENGEKEAERDNVYTQLGQQATIDLAITGTAIKGVQTLGAVNVRANALASTFQPDNKGLTTYISRKQLQTIPAPNRSIQNIVRVDPRITVTDRGRPGGGEFSAVGQNSRYNYVTIDGVPTNDLFGLEANGLPAYGQPISIDWVDAYNVSTANYDVANPRGVGADVNLVTRSGGNEFHGGVYYAYGNAKDLTGQDVNGNDYAAYNHKYTAGIYVDGPIVKDKLFFFAGYEKSVVSGLNNGDYGPSDSNAANKLPGITQSQLNQIIQTASNLGLKPGSLASAADFEDKKYIAKLDWNINENHRASFRFNEIKSTQPVPQGSGATSIGLSSYWYTNHRDFKNYALNLYDDWSPDFSTEASVSYAKYDTVRSAPAQQPQVQVFLGVGPDGKPNGTSPSVLLGEDQFSDYNVLHVKEYHGEFAGIVHKGEHVFKAGMDYQQDNIYNLFGRTEFGQYTFWGLQNFANGIYNQYNLYQPSDGNVNDIAARFTLRQYGFFAQDTWQIGNLSLQYGLRYDLPKISDKPPLSPLFLSTYGYPNNTTIDGNGILEPRLSFNYKFDSQRLTQLRGGAGVFETDPPTVWLANPFANNGVTVTTYGIRNANNVPPNGTTLPFFSPNPFGQNVPPPSAQLKQQAIDVVDGNFKLPNALKVSLGFDRELPWWGTIFSADVLYVKTLDGIWYRNLNLGAPTGTLPDGRNFYYSNSNDPASKTGTPKSRANANPAFSQNMTLLSDTHKGFANAITLALRRPLQGDWAASAGVTFGSAREVNPGTSSQATSNFSNRAWFNPNDPEDSTANYNIAKRAFASLTWQHRFFGNYATTATIYYEGHTGTPYSWVFGNDANGDGYSFSDLVYIPRPGDVEFKPGTSQKTIDQFYAYIGQDDYLRNHQGEVAGRNRAHSPWINQLDLSFSQEVPGLFKGNKGIFRMDVFNFLNLLNSHWGRENRVGFPYTRSLATYAGVDKATGKYVYSLPADGAGNYLPQQTVVYDGDPSAAAAVSRWSILLTAKYEF